MDVLLSFLFSIIKSAQNTSTVYLSIADLCNLNDPNEKMHLSFYNIPLNEIRIHLNVYIHKNVCHVYCSPTCNLYEQKRRPYGRSFCL